MVDENVREKMLKMKIYVFIVCMNHLKYMHCAIVFAKVIIHLFFREILERTILTQPCRYLEMQVILGGPVEVASGTPEGGKEAPKVRVSVCLCLCNDKSSKCLYTVESFISELHIDACSTGPSSVFKIVKMIMERNFQPVIIFSFSKKECEAYALQVAKLDFNKGV